jgi:hypothetical protein
MRVVRFFEAIYADNRVRSASERRKLLGDLVLYLRNALLRPLDGLLVHWHARRNAPVVFIVGAPRSGTTLLYQTLTRHLAVGYVRNAVAKFWSAPLVGSVLCAWQHRRTSTHAEFTSEYGRTDGAHGPHEFSWFWHYWGDFRAHDDLRGKELEAVDWSAIAARLRGLAGFSQAPFVLKSINFTNYQVDVLAQHLPDARFIWISREPFFAAQSILHVREKRYADRNRWWSVRPRDVDAWKGRSAPEQVAHQISDIEHALSVAQAALPQDRFCHVRYEDLVSRPADVVRTIAEFLGVELTNLAQLEELAFKSRNEVTLSLELTRSLEQALES